MSSSEQRSWSVCPLRAFRRSSSSLRLGSASALNTPSISGYVTIRLPILGIRMVACQGSPHYAGPRQNGAVPAIDEKDRLRALLESGIALNSELSLDALLQK